MEKTILALGVLLLLGATFYMSNSQPENNEQVDLFQRWKLKYNKKYTSQDQEWYRFRVFLESLQKIKAHYESPIPHTYTVALNQFSDLTQDEFAQTYLNLQVPRNHVTVEANENYSVKGSDFSSKCPPVRNQGQCGSCWAFSAVGVIECNSNIERSQGLDLSEQDLVDCSGQYGNQGCNGGWMDSAFDYIIDNGLANEKDYSYTGRDGKCKSVARDFHLSGYTDVTSGDCKTLAEAAQQRAVAVAVDASVWSSYSGGVLNRCSKNLNHGVVVVGVTDSGTWIVRNSWGQGWGESGHIQLAAGDTCGVCQFPSYPKF